MTRVTLDCGHDAWVSWLHAHVGREINCPVTELPVAGEWGVQLCGLRTIVSTHEAVK